MTRRQERARASRNNSARHSNLMAGGRGEPREHRRGDQSITDHDIDERFFAIQDGKLTLDMDAAGLARLLEGAVGAGLELRDGKLAVRLGATLALDRDGSMAVRFTEVSTLTDDTAGTPSSTLAVIPDPANSPATADALRDDLVLNALPAIRDALASLSAAVNGILSSASTSTR